ncbi:hypothetical protein [uncultured Draconibacterium sp.]|uniref:hypothetical protein n=1 Tax=uncultured Draconibacterium sp. TaxID=1573823 RepID=UPI0029C76DEE|nr:hypothetical protein [uncultured Draconibacterium sp.]
MYTPGSILYFTPFHFPNGAPAKNKYFIVLYSNETTTIIATLPTSKDHIPEQVNKKHGCIEMPSIHFNCYYFEANKPITDDGWGFPRETYVYGEQVAEFNKKNFDDNYAVEGVDYDKVGNLSNTEYTQLLECVKKSGRTKRKIRRILGVKI